MLRAALRPLLARWRAGGAGAPDISPEQDREAASYWADSTRSDWKLNSHWRDAKAKGWAQTWQEIGVPHLQMYQRFQRALQLRPPERIMEWGVGGGANAIHFAPLAREFLAVDISRESLVESVRQIGDVCPVPVATTLVSLDNQGGPVAHLARTVDLFLCFYVLELVPSEGHAREIVRIAFEMLRQGGGAIIQTKYARSAPRGRDVSYTSNLANNYVVGIVQFWELLHDAGFSVHHVELTPRTALDRNYAYFFATRGR